MANVKSKRHRGDSQDGPANKRFKSKGNKNRGQKNFKNAPKNKSTFKKKNAPAKKKAPANKSAPKTQNEPVKKEEKENVSKFEKSNGASKGGFNKFKAAKFSGPGVPNKDLKKYRKSENIKEDTTGEKPNWMEYKKQAKELRSKRRAKKLEDAYDTAVEAKKIGEQLRRDHLDPKVAEKITKKFHDLVQNQYAKMIFAHDLARVIQWQIKYSSPDIQLAIVQELKPHLREMIHSKYARHIISTLLKSKSNSVKKIILEPCYGDVVKLLSSVLPSSIFEKIYVEVASDAEKRLFKQELYGDIYRKSKDPKVGTLTDVYKNSESMRAATLSAVKSNLIKIINKNLINSTLVHTVLYEYLSNCSKDDRNEMLALVRPLIAELSQTKDGTKVGNMCIWYGTNKDRKHIMKTLKEHVTKIMTSEHGYLLILCLLDTIDDTVLLKKILLQEVLNNLSEIVVNEYGRLVILYLVARRDTRFFHPTLIQYLKLGDGNETSKKPADVREKELLDNVIDNLLQSVASDAEMWLSNGSIQTVTQAILRASSGDKPKAAFEAVAQFICNPKSVIQVAVEKDEKKDGKKVEKKSEKKVEKKDVDKESMIIEVEDKKQTPAIEDAGLHMTLKKVIQMDAKRREKNELTFGEVLLQYLTDEAIDHWIKFNRGCFLLVLLLENESEDVVSKLKSKLKKKKISLKDAAGASILLKKLG